MDVVIYIGVGVLVVAFLLIQWVPVWRGWLEQGRPVPDLPEWLASRLGAGGSALVFFHSPRCSACRAMMPATDRLAERCGGVIKVDVTEAPEVARRFGVMATPTTMRVMQGKIERVRVGQLSAGELEALWAPGRPGVGP